ncbi:MAG: universal stress protein [Ectothiorhodospiraceae bacterium]|nr:universal stress protein [Ectothiorhodospiraceae bacterium]
MPVDPYTKIIVPLDGSENALRALQHAVSLARAAGMELHLLHAFPVGSTALMDLLHYPEIAKAKAEGQLRRAREEEAARIFPVARERIPDGVQVEEVSVMGDPAEEILGYAGEHPEAMIVMGTRGASEYMELLVGSVTTQVVHHATCPVTIVH